MENEKVLELENFRLNVMAIFRGFVSDDFTAYLEDEKGRSFLRNALKKIGPNVPNTFLTVLKRGENLRFKN